MWMLYFIILFFVEGKNYFKFEFAVILYVQHSLNQAQSQFLDWKRDRQCIHLII